MYVPDLCRAWWNNRVKNGDERKRLVRDERKRESPTVFPIRRHHPPHWVIYFLSSPSCPNFHPPHLLLLSFILSLRFFPYGQLVDAVFFRHDDRNTFRQAALWKWLTCELDVLTARFFSALNLVRNKCLISMTREHENIFYFKSNSKWCISPLTNMSVWHCSAAHLRR